MAVLFVVLALNQFAKGLQNIVYINKYGSWVFNSITFRYDRLTPIKNLGGLLCLNHFILEWNQKQEQLPMIIMFIVTAVETVGDVSAITIGGAGREAADENCLVLLYKWTG